MYICGKEIYIHLYVVNIYVWLEKFWTPLEGNVRECTIMNLSCIAYISYKLKEDITLGSKLLVCKGIVIAFFKQFVVSIRIIDRSTNGYQHLCPDQSTF